MKKKSVSQVNEPANILGNSRQITNQLKKLNKFLEVATACNSLLEELGDLDEVAEKCESIYDHVNWAFEVIGEFGYLETYVEQLKSIDEKANRLNIDLDRLELIENQLDRVIGKQQQALVNQAILEGLDNE